MSKLDRAYNITTIKFEIVSVNAAFMKKGIVNTFGPDSVRFNITGTVEEVETSSTTVEGRVNIAKMMEIYQKGLPFSIKYKKDLGGEIFVTTRNCSNEDYEYALKSSIMHTDSMHSAKMRAAATICCCSTDDIENIEGWDAL